MSYEIYFDESHKLDKYTSNYSYYGIIGWDKTTREKFDRFMLDSGIYNELHFSKFKLDKIDNYIKTIEYALNKIESNFYIVDTNEAFNICDKIGIKKTELRSLFYIKIPERLIYGITRKLEKFNNVDIYIDKSDEYGLDSSDSSITDLKDSKHIQLPKTLKTQLNAQSIYRELNYSINKVNQIDSKSSKSLQVIDVLLGIIVVLFEERYNEISVEIKEKIFNDILTGSELTTDEKTFFEESYRCKPNKNSENIYYLSINRDDEDKMAKLKTINRKIHMYSTKSIQRSELIYKLLNKRENLNLFYNLSIFLWGDFSSIDEFKNNVKSKEIIKDSISKYIAQFFQFKSEYDNLNRLKLIKFNNYNIINNKELLEEKDYTEHLGFGSSMKLLTRRYLKELNIKTQNNIRQI